MYKTTPSTHNKEHSRLTLLLLCSLLLIIIAGGTIGYRILENYSWLDSLYMTFITVSTVGMGELQPLSPQGRILTIILIIFGVGIVAFAVTRIVDELMRRQISRALGRRNMEKVISAIKNHTIICGFGRMGETLYRQLEQRGKKVVVIEQKAECVQRKKWPHLRFREFLFLFVRSADFSKIWCTL